MLFDLKIVKKEICCTKIGRMITEEAYSEYYRFPNLWVYLLAQSKPFYMTGQANKGKFALANVLQGKIHGNWTILGRCG